MIDNIATFNEFGYYPDDLAPKSNKSIIAVCDICGKERVSSKCAYRALCLSCGHSGNLHWNYGKHHSDETKKLIQDSVTGFKHTDETKARMSANNNQWGINNHRWKGGEQISRRKDRAFRRTYGYEPLNNPFPGCDGHHITKTLVIHIPKELHRHIAHSQVTNVGMAEMNMLAIQYMNGEI